MILCVFLKVAYPLLERKELLRKLWKMAGPAWLVVPQLLEMVEQFVEMAESHYGGTPYPSEVVVLPLVQR